MPVELKVDRERGVIELKHSGLMRAEDASPTFARIMDAVEREGISRLLVDISAVDQGLGIKGAQEAMSEFPEGIRQAIMLGSSPPKVLEGEVAFVEDYCENRGRATAVFRTRDEALEWLLSGDAAPVAG